MKIILIIIGLITALIMLFLFCAFFVAQKSDLLMEQMEKEDLECLMKEKSKE